MKVKTIAAALACGLAVAVHADEPAGDATRGKALFMKNMCYTCHGTAGQGGERGSGPRIAYDVWPWEAFRQAVRRPSSSMPRYDVQFVSEQDLADIYAYVKSVKRNQKASEIPLLKE